MKRSTIVLTESNPSISLIISSGASSPEAPAIRAPNEAPRTICSPTPAERFVLQTGASDDPSKRVR